MDRFTAVKSQGRTYGYSVRDSVPHYQDGIDVEGVGWCPWKAPRLLPAHSGWYRRKRDAQHRADVMNAAAAAGRL